MLTEERKRIILQILKRSGTATVEEISKATGTSESTVRRDLNLLASEGKLKRVHGGAMLTQIEVHSYEEDIAAKSEINTEEKDMIGKYAAKQINDSDIVFIDAGTTTGRMIDFLPPSKAVFVTNGIDHVRKLVQKGFKAYIIGGQPKLSTEAVIGSIAAEGIRKFNFTKAFIGANGISEVGGFTTPDADEAMIKSLAVERAFASFVLADHSKFGKVYPITFAPITNCCIITDKLPTRKLSEFTVIKEVAFYDLHSDL